MDPRRHSRGSGSSSSLHRHQPSGDSTHHYAFEAQGSHASGKRKADEAGTTPEKRRRLDWSSASSNALPSVAGLPAHIWQNVFLYLPPVALGRLLQVNRAFHTYLTQVVEPHPGSRVLSSESIWSSARKIHFPSLLKPLTNQPELSMWRLLKGRRCQFCGKVPRFEHSIANGPWEGGPGHDGVRIIWPFGVRSCGRCLEERSEKEQSLLFSSASVLIPALSYVFVTQNLHIVPSSSLSSSSIPPQVTISKWYYQDQVQQIQRQLEEVRGLGSAVAEEWFKGLASLGKERLQDAERWERWERKGGLQDLSPIQSRATSSSTMPASLQQEPPVPYTVSRPLPMSGVPRGVPRAGASFGSQYPASAPEQHASPPYNPQGTGQPPRPERNIRDANEGKAARKSQIERRCQEEFNPPIVPNVLRHMKAFQAACQISSPMTDRAWEMLKPRIEAQRDEAEKVEHERAAQMAALQVKLEDRRQQDANMKEVREVLEREWEEAQRPVRDRLSAIADEIIRQDWDEGRSITKDNAPSFAANLLGAVRRRFYFEQARDDDATLDRGEDIREDPPTGPPTRRLLLENMKWVFDNKIKPLTEQFRKELFICSGEGCEGNPKMYGFEGIIQHYGAKHTTAFSVGNVVVCWKEADWPENPPFHPDPGNARYGFHGNGMPTSSGVGHGPPQHGYPPYPYGGYSQGASSTPQIAARTPHPPFSRSSPGSYGQYGPITSGPYPQPPPPTGYYGHGSGPPPPTYGPPGSGSPYGVVPQAQWHDGSYSYDGYGASHVAASQGYGYSPQVAAYGPPHSMPGYGDQPQGQFGLPPPAVNAPGAYGPYHGGSHYESPPAPPTGPRGPPPTNFYQDQLRLFTDVARDFWTSTSGIRDLVPSLDWKKDMIELPDDDTISALIRSPGMDDHKLHIIAEAFPRLFRTPLPHIGVVVDEEAPPTGRPTENPPETPAYRSRFADDQESRPGSTPASRTRPPPGEDRGAPPSGRSPRDNPPVGEREYDSHHSGHEPRRNSRPPRHAERMYSPHPDDRRMRVYYDEPRYYVARESVDRGYPRRRESYMPLSPAASRRYSYFGRAYDDTLDSPRHESRYPDERDIDHQSRLPSRSGLRYLDRPEIAASTPVNPPPEPQQRPEDEPAIKQEPADVEAAADRFLDDLATGVGNRQPEEPEESTREPSRMPPDAPPQGERPDGQPQRDLPPRENGYDAYPPHLDDPRAHHYYDQHGTRDDGYMPAPRPEPRRYTYAPSRYRRVLYREDPYYAQSHRIVRTRSSRYGRYEATRRRLEQSRSPTRDITREASRMPEPAREDTMAREGTIAPEMDRRPSHRGDREGTVEPAAYRDRDEAPPPRGHTRYRSESHFAPRPPAPAGPREYHPYDDEPRGRDPYSPGPPPGYGYRFVEERPPPPAPGPYLNEYGEMVEYVIREPYRRYEEYAPDRRYEEYAPDRRYDPYGERRYLDVEDAARRGPGPGPASGPGGDHHGRRYVEYVPYEHEPDERLVYYQDPHPPRGGYLEERAYEAPMPMHMPVQMQLSMPRPRRYEGDAEGDGERGRERDRDREREREGTRYVEESGA